MKIIVLLTTILALGIPGLILIGGICLQVYLSKMESKWPGLILPGITLGFSILSVLSMAAFSSMTLQTQVIIENGQLIEQVLTNTENSTITSLPPAIFSAFSIFILSNIPTALLLVIYVSCRPKKKRAIELEKMNIQDLE